MYARPVSMKTVHCNPHIVATYVECHLSNKMIRTMHYHHILHTQGQCEMKKVNRRLYPHAGNDRFIIPINQIQSVKCRVIQRKTRAKSKQRRQQSTRSRDRNSQTSTPTIPEMAVAQSKTQHQRVHTQDYATYNVGQETQQPYPQSQTTYAFDHNDNDDNDTNSSVVAQMPSTVWFHNSGSSNKYCSWNRWVHHSTTEDIQRQRQRQQPRQQQSSSHRLESQSQSQSGIHGHHQHCIPTPSTEQEEEEENVMMQCNNDEIQTSMQLPFVAHDVCETTMEHTEFVHQHLPILKRILLPKMCFEGGNTRFYHR